MQSLRLKAWSVHLFTASGVLAGVMALSAIRDHDIRTAFLWMMLAVFIDSADGTLARRWQVRRYAPEVDGRRLDDIVDYFNWVIVPVVAMAEWGWLPPGIWVVPLICSALGISHQQAKTEDHYFLGFPSLWNVVALYLWFWEFPAVLNGAIVVTLALTVLLPIRFVYPSKTPTLRRTSMVLMMVWLALVVAALLLPETTGRRCFLWSSFFPVYYLALSFWLHSQDKPGGARMLPTLERRDLDDERDLS